MPKLSRRQLKDPIVELIVSELHNAFLLLKDESDALAFLNCLLTPTEIIMLSKRLSIARMYVKGENYQAIKDELKVTDGTIARISTQLTKNKVLKRIIQDLESIEKQRLTFTPPPKEPMDKYLQSTRAVGKAITSTGREVIKKIRQTTRHHRLKSKLRNSSSS